MSTPAPTQPTQSTASRREAGPSRRATRPGRRAAAHFAAAEANLAAVGMTFDVVDVLPGLAVRAALHLAVAA